MTEPQGSMTAMIVDDEPLARGLVREYLQAHADVHVVSECGNGEEALGALQQHQPDLLFLDIQMPSLTGFEVLELSGRQQGVIFTTAHDEHAVAAFERHALDYLLKPYSQARFDQALAHARKTLGQTQAGLQQLRPASPQWLERIVVRDRQRVHVLGVAQVDYVQAQDDYVAIHCQGREYLKAQTLADLATQLDPQVFVRVHRSYLLNITHLQRLEKLSRDSYVAHTHGGAVVAVSRSGYDRLGALLGN